MVGAVEAGLLGPCMCGGLLHLNRRRGNFHLMKQRADQSPRTLLYLWMASLVEGMLAPSTTYWQPCLISSSASVSSISFCLEVVGVGGGMCR